MRGSSGAQGAAAAVDHEPSTGVFSSCSRPPGSSLIGRTIFSLLRRIISLPDAAPDSAESRRSRERSASERRSSNSCSAASVDVIVDDNRHASPATKQRRMSGEPPASAPTATAAEALPPRKARAQQQAATAALKQPPPPAAPQPAPPPPQRHSQQQSQACPPANASVWPPPAPPPPAQKPVEKVREVSMRNYCIGGLTFEVDARYKIKSIVGKGAYGLVCAAEDLCPSPKDEPSPKVSPKESGAPPTPTALSEDRLEKSAPTMVAVKKVIDPFHDHTDCKRLLREIRLLCCLRHPNVLHLSDIMPARSPSPEHWKDVYLVTRLFDTNLHRVIYSGHALTDAHIQYILWQVFRALRYLHAAGVVHRDMKPTNLLLNRDCELALADFGLARFMPHTPPAASPHTAASSPGGSDEMNSRHSSGDDKASAPAASGVERSKAKGGQLTKYVVTRWYRAPELLVQNRQYDFKVDMWSTGCILAEVLGAKAIFPGKDSLHQLRLVVERLGLPSDEELSTIHNAQAVAYIRNLRPKEHAASDPAAAATRFAQLYPHASPLLLDLLARLLQFDARKRPTAEEALAHPYLAAYRDAPEEGLPTPEVEMHFEGEDPSTDQLRHLIWQEVLRYHPQLAHGQAPSPASSVTKL